MGGWFESVTEGKGCMTVCECEGGYGCLGVYGCWCEGVNCDRQ